MSKLSVSFKIFIITVSILAISNNKAKADAGTSALYGYILGPINTHIVLQNNGGEDLTIVIDPSPSNNYHYNTKNFKFPNQMPDGTPYSLTIKEQSDNLTCSIYKARSGVLPLTSGYVLIGCEKTYDYVSLGNTPSERGTYYYSSNPGIGGSNTSIGGSTYTFGEGRFVVFSSSLALAGSKGIHRQVFFRDRLAGETILVSKDKDGVEGNGDSTNPTIAADGIMIAFESYATNLDGFPDTNGARDVFTSFAGSVPSKVSVGMNGVEANSESFDPILSGNGLVVAFSSSASNLTPGVVGTGTVNIYRSGVFSKETTLISVDQKGNGSGGSYPSMSEDGSNIAFYSFSSKITADDTNNLWDIFVFENSTKLIRRVSLTTTGGERNSGSESVSHTVPPTISGNGRYVAFSTTATNMAAGDNNGKRDVFVADLATNTVQWASAGIGGAAGNGNSPVGQSEKVALSYNGRWIAFTTNSGNLYKNSNPGNENIVMRNLDTGETKAITDKEGYSFGAPVLSRDASFVMFGSSFRFDDAYPSSGFFSYFTGIGLPFWWIP